ncbi:MAG: AAA family ATPase [Deltaproteobacteria bacterium]|nr:AAA family ATPase [Deltaproteobacteria bacterium]
MKIRRLTLEKFTSFQDAEFEFTAGVNVLIGENGTGKTHILKLLYVLGEAIRNHLLGGLPTSPTASTLAGQVEVMLREVFLAEGVGRLVKRVHGQSKAQIRCEWDNGAALEVIITKNGKVEARILPNETAFAQLAKSIFLPTREVISIFPGFVAAWTLRESAFDRTYYDLCNALSLSPLRGPRDAIRAALIEPLEQALEAKVLVENGRFYLHYSDGKIEAPLVAEGHRKLAMLAYLVMNGSLTDNGILFWDEPEASLNPKLALLTTETMFRLNQLGIQIFLSTHDYAMSSEISLIAERDGHGTRFFGLRRTPRGIEIESGATATSLEFNPILDGLSNLHDREQAFLAEDAEQ